MEMQTEMPKYFPQAPEGFYYEIQLKRSRGRPRRLKDEDMTIKQLKRRERAEKTKEHVREYNREFYQNNKEHIKKLKEIRDAKKLNSEQCKDN